MPYMLQEWIKFGRFKSCNIAVVRHGTLWHHYVSKMVVCEMNTELAPLSRYDCFFWQAQHLYFRRREIAIMPQNNTLQRMRGCSVKLL